MLERPKCWRDHPEKAQQWLKVRWALQKKTKTDEINNGEQKRRKLTKSEITQLEPTYLGSGSANLVFEENASSGELWVYNEAGGDFGEASNASVAPRSSREAKQASIQVLFGYFALWVSNTAPWSEGECQNRRSSHRIWCIYTRPSGLLFSKILNT